MRTLEKLSPSSLHLWETDREEFYLRYLSDNKQPREPQTAAMVIGSAFDAFVKSSLHFDLVGHNDDGVLDAGVLFADQVQNKELRRWAWSAGRYAFDCYYACGAYTELLREAQHSESLPRFEFELVGEVGGVPLCGYPDMYYSRDAHVILDWKVNGFCSDYAQSPKKFYKTCRDGWDGAKPTRGGGGPRPHKNYSEMDFHGHKIGCHYLEEVDTRWADQISIYSWMLGADVGADNVIACIDQLACKPSDARWPLIRVAQHRCRVSACWQNQLLSRLQSCWSQVQSGHVFDDLSKNDSDARCALLDMPQPETDEFWAACNERQYRG